MLFCCLGVTLKLHVVDSTWWRQILVENRDFCLPYLYLTPPLGRSPLEYCHNFRYGKREWCGYPAAKNVEDVFIRFVRIQKRRTDGRTDEQTSHDGIYRDYAWHRAATNEYDCLSSLNTVSGVSLRPNIYITHSIEAWHWTTLSDLANCFSSWNER